MRGEIASNEEAKNDPALPTLEHQLRPSVEITRNAAGKYAWRIRAYGDLDPEGVAAAAERATEVDTALRRQFS